MSNRLGIVADNYKVSTLEKLLRKENLKYEIRENDGSSAGTTTITVLTPLSNRMKVHKIVQKVNKKFRR